MGITVTGIGGICRKAGRASFVPKLSRTWFGRAGSPSYFASCLCGLIRKSRSNSQADDFPRVANSRGSIFRNSTVYSSRKFMIFRSLRKNRGYFKFGVRSSEFGVLRSQNPRSGFVADRSGLWRVVAGKIFHRIADLCYRRLAIGYPTRCGGHAIGSCDRDRRYAPPHAA